jgi:energy-coupling factor transporter ATP-binding protein EcfA2
VIEFEDVTVAYKSKAEPVLSSLSFKTNPAEKIGIVGRTGAVNPFNIFFYACMILKSEIGKVDAGHCPLSYH